MLNLLVKSYNEIEYENSEFIVTHHLPNTTKYKFGDFDSDTFGNGVEILAKRKYCNCYEYNALMTLNIWEKQTKTDTKANEKEIRIENFLLPHKNKKEGKNKYMYDSTLLSIETRN